uniref:NPH3 domain-containing protein n=1 Tax=Macrostomum lignano TaxID=282301 RepID=A0A1I8FH55_9PLAT
MSKQLEFIKQLISAKANAMTSLSGKIEKELAASDRFQLMTDASQPGSAEQPPTAAQQPPGPAERPKSHAGRSTFAHSPCVSGPALSMDFNFVGVHPGRYDLLLRVKKLLCDPLDSESVASAADSSGVRVPLLQARPAASIGQRTVSHLLQNYSMQPDRWFYWRLAVLDLPSDGLGVLDLTARVSIMRRGVADAT